MLCLLFAGRARVLQNGEAPESMRESIEACVLLRRLRHGLSRRS